MTSGIRVPACNEARRYYATSSTGQRAAGDERLEAVLQRMTIDELRRLQIALQSSPNFREPSQSITGEPDRAGETIDVMMLLGATAVAIAWWTHRAKAAPQQSIQKGLDAISGGHAYMLPIPRHDPCFCGRQTTFRRCHGQPPNAVPKTITLPRAGQSEIGA